MKAYIQSGVLAALAFLVFFSIIAVALNWARHPGKRKRRKRTGKPPPAGAEETEAAIRRSLKTMDRILIYLGIFLLLFVFCMITLFCIFQKTPDVLIGSVFGAATGEVSAMAAIKRNKDRLRKELREAQGKDPEEETEDNTE